MNTTWEQAADNQAPVIAYLTYKAHLTVFQKEQVKSYLPTVQRLPYTVPMMERRQERGASVPSWWNKVDTFTVGKAAA